MSVEDLTVCLLLNGSRAAKRIQLDTFSAVKMSHQNFKTKTDIGSLCTTIFIGISFKKSIC